MDKDGLIEKDWMVNILYQHSLDKFKRFKDCQMEREIVEEIELNIKKLNMLFHEILLLKNDLIDQCLFAEEVNKEHKGKRIQIRKTRETSENGNSQTKV